MKFSTRQDVEAPADHVFGCLTDFAGFERQAMRRGIEASRRDGTPFAGVGTIWDMRAPFRGKMHDVEIELTRFEPPEALYAVARSGGLTVDITLDVLALSRKRSRLQVGCDLRPKSFSARVLLQSMKFAKGSLQKRFEKRAARFCAQMSVEYDPAA
nr:SRPBCC family protein [uncultured Celeribacter sp.]